MTNPEGTGISACVISPKEAPLPPAKSESFFDKYEEKLVKLNPYSGEMKSLAHKYLQEVKTLLSGQEVGLEVIGSVAYKIPASDLDRDFGYPQK